MRSSICLLLAVAVTTTTLTGAQASGTRPSPSYSVKLVDGTTASVESYRGRVVLLAFINTECPHCQRTSQMLQRLQAAHGDKHVQPFAVAMNQDAATRVPAFVERFGISYPVGIDTQANARKYLGIPATGWVMAPVLVIIDRQGTIRAEYGGSDPAGDDEPMLRALIEKLVTQGQTSAQP